MTQYTLTKIINLIDSIDKLIKLDVLKHNKMLELKNTCVRIKRVLEPGFYFEKLDKKEQIKQFHLSSYHGQMDFNTYKIILKKQINHDKTQLIKEGKI